MKMQEVESVQSGWSGWRWLSGVICDEKQQELKGKFARR